MKLRLKTQIDVPGMTVNKEYELKPAWGNCFRTLNDEGTECIVPLDNFETINERFASFTPTKRIVAKPHKGYTTDLLMTENFFIVYQHSKGNHWNVFGNHYRYYHDINTGEFIPEHELSNEQIKERVLIKERIVLAIYNKLYSPK